METQNQVEVEDKIFGSIVGKIIPESVVVDNEAISFDFKAGKNIHRFAIADKISTKLFSLHGLSMREVYKETMGNVSDVEECLRNAIKAYNRNVVVLVDDKILSVSIVSEQHKQLPLSEAFKMVDAVAQKNGAKLVSKSQVSGSYRFDYEIANDANMSLRVSAFLGRNDALGRGGISFSGAGHIFVCSNMIVPHIDADVKFTASSNDKLMATKIVHTLNIESRLYESLQKSFECAKQNILVLSRAFEASRKIKMSRELQLHCIELITLKKTLPDTWNWQVRKQLRNEEETLYGLSQAFTYVGTHVADKESAVAKDLLKIGGQVVLLGDKFVELIRTSIKNKGLIVPELKVQA